jgi:hypothetical protein
VLGEQSLLDADHTKTAIEELFDLKNEQIFLSAFFTDNAFEWLRVLADGAFLQIVIRARPNDLLTGATDLNAIRHAVGCGWDIRFISVLHAKVYLLGSKIIVGSGNLTSNGMHLMGGGNLELNSIVDATSDDVSLVKSIFEEAMPFDEDIISKMEEFLQKGCDLLTVDDWWPPDVLPIVERALFCNDFPQNLCGSEHPEMGAWSGIDQFLVDGDGPQAAQTLQKTRAYGWLLSAVEREGGEARFGALSKNLHDALVDDPSPYRSTVKSLLSNLLTYIHETPGIDLGVERPRHSQVVKMLQ